MAKNMARVINGIVINIERHSDTKNDTDDLISIRDLPVTFGDTFDGEHFYHNGEKILTITDELTSTIKEKDTIITELDNEYKQSLIELGVEI